MWFPLLLLVLAVLFQKLPTHTENPPTSDDSEAGGFLLFQEPNTFRRQQPPNTFPSILL
jgi:hypothetical protein